MAVEQDVALKLSQYAKGKFIYTLQQKIPEVDFSLYSEMDMYSLFFINDGLFTIYFYIDLVRYLDKQGVNYDILEHIIRFAAITQLFNRNALIYSEDNTVYTFVRNGEKVFKIISKNIDEVLAEYKIVKGFVCNGWN